ncbi:23S ribosomal RNA methyltransferase Erm [Salinactinospora qingdaonensis]|uniref:Ribosomal RNA adenine methylase transferase N-terminal domain-containing protein n=1 Tax=Salinactinospora qingdaonensis TaxID=702744 RepID=A0ABP7F6P0_9ACTN
MPSSYAGGPHELGQNLLVDRGVISAIDALIARTTGPIVELGPGDGALTLPLSRLGRNLTVVEVDPKRARRLDRRTPDHVVVHTGDALTYRFPRHPHVIVGNIPFHLTTRLLRRILAASHWSSATLLVQWEVARRRAGVGGATLLTASWWPWYEFTLHQRVPARAFRPVPGVDGGLLTMTRRATPLVADRAPYQRFVKEVFTGRGRGVQEVLTRTGRFGTAALRGWLREHRVSPQALPKDLTAHQWASLWHLASQTAPTPPSPSRSHGSRRSRPTNNRRR